jgi:TonB family protein
MRNKTGKLLLALTAALCAAPVDAHAAEGSLDQDLIRRVVRAHGPEIEACYEAALDRDAEANGIVLVAFTIGTSGEVTAATIEQSDIADRTLHACMRGAVQKWLFPRPEGGSVEVRYPFVLVPQLLDK